MFSEVGTLLLEEFHGTLNLGFQQEGEVQRTEVKGVRGTQVDKWVPEMSASCSQRA